MSNIKNGFNNGKKSLIVFLTAGDPFASKTVEYVLEMEKAGADLVEIGIPFSDPVAEGTVIQAANERALSRNIKLDDVFNIVEKIREKSNIPLVFLTYVNPIFNHGVENFLKRCEKTGIDGIIIPDLPFEEKNIIQPYSKKYNVDLISLIAPTSKDRIEKISKEAEGFIYCVSSLGVTGMRTKIETDLKSLTDEIKKYAKVPVAIGFGVSGSIQVAQFKDYCDGVIVGSAIVKIIEKYGENAGEKLYEFVRSLKRALG